MGRRVLARNVHHPWMKKAKPLPGTKVEGPNEKVLSGDPGSTNPLREGAAVSTKKRVF
jgi:hypothetical protein